MAWNRLRDYSKRIAVTVVIIQQQIIDRRNAVLNHLEAIVFRDWCCIEDDPGFESLHSQLSTPYRSVRPSRGGIERFSMHLM